MTMVNGTPRAGLVQRVQNILLRPKLEWDVIDAEPASIQGLFTGYAMILAAIGPVCSAIGMVVFGFGVPGILSIHASPVGAIASAVVSYALALVITFLVGLVIDALAPSFGGVKNQIQAMKVAVYGSTAAWVAGVFGIFPPLAILGIVGLYSLYLYYVGLPKLMKTPPDKALGYTAVVVICFIVLSIIVGVVTAPLRMLGAAGLAAPTAVTVVGANGALAGTVAGVDLGKLQAASKQMEASASAMQAQAAVAGATTNGGTVVVKSGAVGIAPDTLKSLLPGGVAGFTRTEVSAESAGAAGLNTSHAEAHYAKGDSTMTVEVTDTGAMAGLAGMASAFNVNSNKETATGYEKVGNIDGRMTTEEYDRTSKHGKYSVIARNGLVVNAEGDKLTMDDLKAAVGAVGVPRVEQLAKR